MVMQARFYLPMYGRFASPDPARDQYFEHTQSWNIYSYVQNDPTMKIDPTGMFAVAGYWGSDPDLDTDGGPKGAPSFLDNGGSSSNGKPKHKPNAQPMPEATVEVTARAQTGGAESVGQWAARNAVEALRQDHKAAGFFWSLLETANGMFTPGGDRLSQVNARAQNDEDISIEELAEAGGLALGQVALTAAPGLITTKTLTVAAPATEANKLNHIFGKAIHNLGGVVKHYGSQKAAFTALKSATEAAVKSQGLTGAFQTVVKVGGAQVTVRGIVVDGVVHIGTAFIP